MTYAERASFDLFGTPWGMDVVAMLLRLSPRFVLHGSNSCSMPREFVVSQDSTVSRCDESRSSGRGLVPINTSLQVRVPIASTRNLGRPGRRPRRPICGRNLANT